MAFNPRTINKELDFANLAKHNDNYAAIKTELDAHDTHIAAKTAHGSTSTATAGAIMQRDSAGRAKVTAPAAADDIARKAEVDAVQDALDAHEVDASVHLTTADRAKLDGVAEGAEPNQNAFAQVNNVAAASESDALTITGGTGISVTTNPTTKTVTVTATGTATPGAHGSSHNNDGSDPIPDLVALRDEFDALTPASFGAETPAGAQAKVDALAGVGNTKTVAEISGEVAGVTAQLAETKTYSGRKFTLHNPYKDGGSLSLKGQMHCHTTNSTDGHQSPFDVVTAYKNAGYDFIAITDHDYITPDPGVPGITFIQSIEESTATAHITAYDVTERAWFTSAQRVIDFEAARGKLSSIAHPNWSVHLIDKEELIGYYDYNFTEIFSSLISHYAAPAEDKVDAVLTSGKRLFYLATDDCHDINDVFNKGWVVVHCSQNTKSDILSNLRKGNFYASNGNDITISVVDNVITASSTSASNIQFIGMGGKVLNSSNGVTTATYTINGDEMYVRVKSTKVSDSTVAWAQPIFLETVGGDERHRLDYARNANLHGVKRQALINGGFTVNQRGAESGTVNNGAPAGYLVDGWFNNLISATVFPPSVTTYRRELTWPEEKYGKYCLGISWSGPESGPYTGTAEYGVFQRIENGTRLLCGGNKKVTLSFYARATLAPRRIGVVLKQRYGTGGSPSGSDDLLAGIVDLVTTFKKYELVVETKSLEGKTFGTNGDDYLQVGISCMWHDTAIYGSNEHFGAANGIEIAKVQLNAGDMALPYCERHQSDELRLCQRYYERFDSVGGRANLGIASADSTTNLNLPISFKVEKRVPPTLAQGGAGFRIIPTSAATSLSLWEANKAGAALRCSGSGFVNGQAYLVQSSDSGGWIAFSAEL